jgi:hypothetical protein
VRKGKNINKAWVAGHYPTRDVVDSDQSSDKKRKCADPSWEGLGWDSGVNACNGNFECVDGHNRADCNTAAANHYLGQANHGGYKWRCYVGNDQYPNTGNVPAPSSAGINCPTVYKHICDKSGSVVASYRNFLASGRTDYCNRYICFFNGAETNVAFDNPPSYAGFCRVFHCYVDDDPTTAADEGAAVWYDANDNSDNVNDSDIPVTCKNRCNAGKGSRPINYTQPDPYGQWTNDLRCYQKPKIAFTCNWATGPNGGPYALTQTNGPFNATFTISSYNCGNLVVTRTAIGAEVCVVMTPAITSGWTPDGVMPSPTFAAPGAGLKFDNVTPWTYANWSTRTVTSEQLCADWNGAPFFKVYGSDVRSGGGIKAIADDACLTSAATIRGFNKLSTGGYAGAGAQYAAMATGAITGFASAQYDGYNASPSAGQGTGLTYANAGGVYGGFTTPGCSTYIKDDVPIEQAADIGPIGPLDISPGQDIVRHVQGDVFIKGNIAMLPGATTLEDWPRYKLVVEGNIYISGDVSRLDGVYVALPKVGGGGGTIYTCAKQISPGVYAPETNTLSGTCEKQLVVNGSFAAVSVQLLRDCGSLTYANSGDKTLYAGTGVTNQEKCNDANAAAEIFNFTPDFWVTNIKGAPTTRADSISRMPPVL